jgi:uncharacterized protein (DUF2236 family)
MEHAAPTSTGLGPGVAEQLVAAVAGRFAGRALRTPGIDFTAPAGEPALSPPDGVAWQVFKNPVALFVGGVTAVILELAEPRVRSGVWDHTTFRTDPMARMERTGLAAMVTVYGARSAAERMIAGVCRMHQRVSGWTPAGAPYRADDPELLDWVHATASFGFLEAYAAYVRPLSDAERDRYYAEGVAAARLYGAVGAPASQAELAAQLDAMFPKLERSTIVFEFLDIMRRAPIAPWPLRWLQWMLVRAGVELVPRRVRDVLGLDDRWDLAAYERPAVSLLGRVADRLAIPNSPAVQACRRLGLPADYLYRRAAAG